MPRVTVVIPTWNGASLLTHALRSLERQTWRDFEVVVVDNGSTDGTQDLLAREHPQVRVVRLEENCGFAAAVNAGVRVAAGDIVMLLNNDTEADPGWLAALVGKLDHHPEIASCASKMLDFHDRTIIDSAGDQLGIFASKIGHGRRDGPAFSQPRYVLSACGGAAAYRRRILEELGGFDERFVAYFEDVDLGVRARLAGYRCLYVPDAIVYHYGSATARRVSSTSFFLRMRNSFFLAFQYLPKRRLLPWAPLVFVWPFVCAVREGHPLAVAAHSVLDFVRQAPAVVRRRREALGTRRISSRAFRAELAPPLARNRPIPGARPTSAGNAGRGGVDVIVVNWNGRRYLPECLNALSRSIAPLRVILVDNASEDDSVAYVRAAHPTVEIAALTENSGYAGGANAGLARAGCEFALVMNPDVLIEPDYVKLLRTCMERDPSIGAAQGKLYQVAEEAFSAGSRPPEDHLDSAGHVVLRSRRVLDRGQGQADTPDFSREASVFSASGAALLLRRAMWEDVAPDGEVFDRSFFAYKEDIDLCWRARWLGWDVRYVPDAVARHVRAWSGTGTPPKNQIPRAARRHSWKNHYLLLAKNDRLADLLRALPAVLTWEGARQAYALVRDPALYASYLDLLRALPRALRQRRDLFHRRRVEPAEMRRWFGADPRVVTHRPRNEQPSGLSRVAGTP